MRWVLLVLLVPGCDLIFKLRDPAPGDLVDAPTDGRTHPPRENCSPASMLVDNFSDTNMQVDRPWQLSTSAAVATAVESVNDLNVAVGGGSFEIVAEAYLDVRENSFTFSWRQTSGTMLPNDEIFLRLLSEDQKHHLVFGAKAVAAGSLVLFANYLENGNVFNIGGTPPYDPGEHVSLRIEHTGTTTRFLAAGADRIFDNQIFINDVAPFPWVAFMRPSMFFRANNTTTFTIDEFNMGGTAVGTACPADSIFEGFDNKLSTDWQQLQSNCTIDFETSGSMGFTVDGPLGNGANCTVQTGTYYDLRDRSVTFEVNDFFSAPTSNGRLEIEVVSGIGRGFFELDNVGNLNALVQFGSSPDPRKSITYDPTLHKFLRFRATATDVFIWETSADGRTFDPFFASQAGELGSLDVVRASIRLAAISTEPATHVSFGGINAP